MNLFKKLFWVGMFMTTGNVSAAQQQPYMVLQPPISSIQPSSSATQFDEGFSGHMRNPAESSPRVVQNMIQQALTLVLQAVRQDRQSQNGDRIMLPGNLCFIFQDGVWHYIGTTEHPTGQALDDSQLAPIAQLAHLAQPFLDPAKEKQRILEALFLLQKGSEDIQQALQQSPAVAQIISQYIQVTSPMNFQKLYAIFQMILQQFQNGDKTALRDLGKLMIGCQTICLVLESLQNPQKAGVVLALMQDQIQQDQTLQMAALDQLPPPPDQDSWIQSMMKSVTQKFWDVLHL